ncbi:MAG: trifunctional dihydropteroate synthetase [Peltula sp. TS41687]|nr:MAG: trifunctional dihydropteroate synthetase [Peltula sp. TS41687]
MHYSTASTGRRRAFVAFGSNVGDRVAMIEEGLRALECRNIKLVRTSSLWETEAMYVVNQGRFLNGVCEVETSLGPFDLLDQLKEIESSMGRRKTIEKGPRNIDLDILLYGDEVVNTERLAIPHPLMLEREFVLRPLCELIPHGNLPSDPSTNFQGRLRALPAAKSPMSAITPLSHARSPTFLLVHKQATKLMAILNLTPDSFSDGGLHDPQDLERLVTTASKFTEVGASIVDLGGQSTRPNAEDIGETEELNRVIPAIRAVRCASATKEACISVDTYRARVAEEAIKAGADMINDVSGGVMDPDMIPTVARLGCTICIMHMRGTPGTMAKLNKYPDGLIPTVGKELLSRARAAEEAGIRRWRIILDPGIGFAKHQAQNLEILRRLPELQATKGLETFPWLLGTSRKGFIGLITNTREPRDRTWGTAAAVTAAVAGGADIVRVHDVPEMSQVVKMADAIWKV